VVEFARACEQSTDFHFASLEHQFEQIGDCLVSARDWRLRRKPPQGSAVAADAEALDKMSAKSSASSTSDDVCVTFLLFADRAFSISDPVIWKTSPETVRQASIFQHFQEAP